MACNYDRLHHVPARTESCRGTAKTLPGMGTAAALGANEWRMADGGLGAAGVGTKARIARGARSYTARRCEWFRVQISIEQAGAAAHLGRLAQRR